MPFDRPTVAELKERTAANYAGRMRGPDGRPLGQLLPAGPLRVISDADAGLWHESNGFVAWALDQFFPDTADPEYLERAASWRGLTRKAATKASGAVTVTGTNGTTIPAGRVLKRADGVRYLVDVDTVLTSSPDPVDVTADLAGVAGDSPANTVLTFVNPIPGVNTETTVVDIGAGRGLTGGTDLESDSRLLARLRQVVQNPPQGGALADYVKWTLEVPGVTRAWARALWMGAGSVGVFFVLDDDPVDIIPGAPKLAEVEAYIEGDLDHPRRPVTADVFVVAPTKKVVNYNITLTPNSASVRAAVEAAIRDLHDREADLGVTFLKSHIDEAIATAAGESNHVLNAPAADVTCLPHELPVPGTFTFV